MVRRKPITKGKEMKKDTYKFKSAKGSDFTIHYTPKDTEVVDKKAFQKHLVKVADLFECEGKWNKPKAKVEEKPKKKEKPKAEPNKDLFGGDKV
jgi:hypothetical protein